MKENLNYGEAGDQSEERIMELNDIFEYDVVSILDRDHGGLDIERMSEVIATHASKGWRLVFTFPNEIGHDSSLSELAGVSVGINSTIDQNILVFERCVRRYNR